MGLIEQLVRFSVDFIGKFGYTAIFLLMAVDSCIPIGSEPIMLFAGFLVSQNKMSLIGAILVGTAGNVVGSIVAYYVGDFGGRPFMLNYGKYMLVPPKKFHLAERWFNKYGRPTVFFSRMLPVVRSVISYPAGIAEMNVMQFTLYTTLGSLPWSALFAYLGLVLGNNWENYLGLFHRIDYVLLALAIGVIAFFVISYYLKSKAKARNDR